MRTNITREDFLDLCSFLYEVMQEDPTFDNKEMLASHITVTQDPFPITIMLFAGDDSEISNLICELRRFKKSLEEREK